MLELGGNELAGHFRRLIAADSRLGIPFQLVRRDVHSLPMCLAHLVIAADKSGQRYRLGRAEGRIPPGAVFDRRDGFVFMDLAMANQLFAGRWVLAFGEPSELLGSHRTGKVELSGQFAVPLPLNRVSLFPIVLFGCGEFLFVIGLRLTRGKRFGYHARRRQRSRRGKPGNLERSRPLGFQYEVSFVRVPNSPSRRRGIASQMYGLNI
jgi:hypothetical protein